MRRREFVAGLAGIAILPSAPHARAIPAGKTFQLERVLDRGLSDGNSIVVTRRWDIGFAAAGPGAMRVSGEQTFAQVEAPPALHALAKLEETRRAEEFLPLDLDEQGRILPAEGDRAFAPLPEDLADAAIAYAGAQGAEPSAHADTRRFVERLSDQGIGWLSMLPRDLFFPQARELETRRDLALPDGAKGVVEMREIAQAAPVTGLLDSFRREVTTITHATERRNSETWRLSSTVL